MKKLSALILAAAMLCSLCACGATGGQTAASPSPSQSGYPLMKKYGETAEADLDGDGKTDEITVDTAERDDYLVFTSVRVNGKDFTDYVNGGMGFELADLDPDGWALTDADVSDGRLEIALLDLGPSDDYTTTFLRYDGSSLVCLGRVSGLILSPGSDRDNGIGDLAFDGDGTVRSYVRLSVLQTWFADCSWRVGADGKFAVVPQELYYPTGGTTYPVTALTDVSLYSKNDLGSDATILKKGGRLTIIATDNASWALCRDKNGADRWLHLTADGQKLDTPSGPLFAGQALEGLCFAD